MKIPKSVLRTWQDRGFDDGLAGRIARTPLSAGEEAQQRYLTGFRNGRKKRESEAT